MESTPAASVMSESGKCANVRVSAFFKLLMWIVMVAVGAAGACHANGESVNGKCVCKQGFVGDGIESCAALPVIREIEPRSGPVSGGYAATVYVDAQGESMNQGFCRFGPAVVTAEVSDDAMVCVVPPGREGVVSVYVSRDGKVWSRLAVEFAYRSANVTVADALAWVLMAMLCLAVGGLVWWLVWRDTGDVDEHLPLNKWHMSQGAAIADEKSFVDFIVNITKN